MNPMQLMNMFKQAQNPMAFMQQMVGRNPQMKQVLDNLQGKSEEELKQYAMNMAQSGNINLSEFMQKNFGINIQ